MKSYYKFKVMLYVVFSNVYFTYLLIAMYGFAAAQEYHIESSFLHLLEFYSLILILAIVLIGLPLAFITNFLKIKDKLIVYSSILLPFLTVIIQPLLLGRSIIVYIELLLGVVVIIAPIYIGSLLLAKFTSQKTNQ